jgi:transcription-repair coupling factor (superfamily II helicase)
MVTIDLPLTRFLPTEYIPSEAERLGWYRRLAAVGSEGELQALAEELEDRFGALPPPVESLLLSVRIKLLAREARVSSLTVSREQIIMRTEPGGIYDRVSLHRRYGIQARISTNVLRIPRDVVGADWLGAVETILTEMVALRSALSRPQAAPA